MKNNIIQTLSARSLIQPPSWLPHSTIYEVAMGSVAYGVNTKDSDIDIYAVCVPPKNIVFPYAYGEIFGFGSNIERFDQFTADHIPSHGHVCSNEDRPKCDGDCGTNDSHDITVYNIVKYFQLAMENNPNILDSLFVPDQCVRSSTTVGDMFRARRKDFLHKGSFYKFKGYAYSQRHKMRSSERHGKRKEIFDKYGFDLKFAYNLVRLLYECEMILEEHDLCLTRNRAHLKAIRAGEISLDEIDSFFVMKEARLEQLYENSTLRHRPDEKVLRNLLLSCLEEHYGDMNNANTIMKSDQAAEELRRLFFSLQTAKEKGLF